MKKYTVTLPDVIEARNETEAWDVFLEYIAECSHMGDVTCFDFVEVTEAAADLTQSTTERNNQHEI
jgi:hypothetical protein